MERELIDKFIEVTGEIEATAVQYLTLADGNVDNAIALMFEGNGPVAGDAPPLEPDAPGVRAPILPTQEVLVPTEPACSFPRASNNVFDRFRDFSVEIRRQEEEMTRIANGNGKSSRCKTKRLEDLFRPPYEILFSGTFIEARERAKLINRWLLVNVQNPQEFSCQILNRDIWPNKQIKEIVKDHFVLWQVLSVSSDGKRYIDFYNVNEYPYLAIVDPRTGECIRWFTTITVDNLLTSLNDMLSSQPSPDSAADTPYIEEAHCEPSSSIKRGARGIHTISKDCEKKIKKSRTSVEATTSYDNINGDFSMVSTSTSSGPSTIRGKRSRMMDEVTEVCTESSSNDPALTAKDNDNNSSTIVDKLLTIESNNPEISNGEPLMRLCLRLPSGGKEAISICANNTIENFIMRIEAMGYVRTEYTYLIPFPKTNVGTLPSETLLRDTILYPSNTVFITKV